MRLTEYGFGCDGADPTGALGGGARAASSIQPVALLFKSWIWAKPALRPITRKGRPAGKPYKTGAEEDGLASTPMGCLKPESCSSPESRAAQRGQPPRPPAQVPRLLRQSVSSVRSAELQLPARVRMIGNRLQSVPREMSPRRSAGMVAAERSQ